MRKRRDIEKEALGRHGHEDTDMHRPNRLHERLLEFSPTPNYEENQLYVQIQCVMRAIPQANRNGHTEEIRRDSSEVARDYHIFVEKHGNSDLTNLKW